MKGVLQTIAVHNRSNMFVHKESSTGNVFYLRLIERNSLRRSRPSVGSQLSNTTTAQDANRELLESVSRYIFHFILCVVQVKVCVCGGCSTTQRVISRRVHLSTC